jgi:hypothetical protein
MSTEHWWNDADMVTAMYQAKFLPQCHFVQNKFYMFYYISTLKVFGYLIMKNMGIFELYGLK